MCLSGAPACPARRPCWHPAPPRSGPVEWPRSWAPACHTVQVAAAPSRPAGASRRGSNPQCRLQSNKLAASQRPLAAGRHSTPPALLHRLTRTWPGANMALQEPLKKPAYRIYSNLHALAALGRHGAARLHHGQALAEAVHGPAAEGQEGRAAPVYLSRCGRHPPRALHAGRVLRRAALGRPARRCGGRCAGLRTMAVGGRGREPALRPERLGRVPVLAAVVQAVGEHLRRRTPCVGMLAGRALAHTTVRRNLHVTCNSSHDSSRVQQLEGPLLASAHDAACHYQVLEYHFLARQPAQRHGVDRSAKSSVLHSLPTVQPLRARARTSVLAGTA
jgi:hypothetical protein